MLVHLGDAYHAAGDPEQARQAWQEALAILEDLNHRTPARSGPGWTARPRRYPARPGGRPGSALGGLREDHAVGA